MDHNLTIKDSEFIATYGGTFLTWGKGVSGNTLENVYFRNKVGGYAAFEIGRNSYNNNINRLEYTLLAGRAWQDWPGKSSRLRIWS